MELDGNLLIIGDSFCQNDEHWPSYLRAHLTYPKDKAHVVADPGAGWWPIRGHFLRIKDDNSEWVSSLKTIIFIHTFTNRVHCKRPEVYKTTPLKLPWNWSNKDYTETEILMSLHYKYVYDQEFQDWAQVKWFNELADILLERSDISTVHLFADTSTYDLAKYSRLVGTGNKLIIPTSLMDIVRLQYFNNFELNKMAEDGKYGFYNHFTPHNNIVFAKQIYEMLTLGRTDFDLTQFTPHE
jgi:hypothetical protein